ncbi:YncE family protein [uncultured Pseudoteredinibacter sp.]|uniref:YncE family protein n=1 Tax=uncultured Pseudoteredinibacter sp. TaxID=1641701 RepID=UPI00260A85CF|nr:YncE family protein [uncultured Pseudoteredinibacter sp.]
MSYVAVLRIVLLQVLVAMPSLVLSDTLAVVSRSVNQLSFYDLGSGRLVDHLPLDGEYHELGISPDAKHLVLSKYKDSSGNPGEALLLVSLDGLSQKVIPLPKGAQPHGLSWGLNGLWITDEERGFVYEFIVESGKLNAVDLKAKGAHMLVADNSLGRVYVSNRSLNAVHVIDQSTHQLISTHSASGKGSEGVALSVQSGELWVANRTSNTIDVFDTSSLDIKATISSCKSPLRLAIDPQDKQVLTSCVHEGAVDVYSRRTKARVRKTQLPLVASDGELNDRALSTPASILTHDNGWLVSHIRASEISLIPFSKSYRVGSIVTPARPDDMEIIR